MCFSATLQQGAKKLGAMFQAQVKAAAYADLFERRARGEKLLLGRGLEADFLGEPRNEDERRSRDAILLWHRTEAERLRDEILKQVARRDEARAKLGVKTTKKAENDLRIALNKIEKMTRELARHEAAPAPDEGDDRVFPRAFASMVCTDREGRRAVIPVRYLLRPHDKDEEFDLRFHGCYNARRDALYAVAWWRQLLGRRHGLICVRNFFEYVAREDYPGAGGAGSGASTRPGGAGAGAPANLELEFTPESEEWLLVPTLWDSWKDKEGRVMYSAALITDTPLPDVARAGHDRSPIFLTAKGAEEWLALKSDDPAQVNAVLDQKAYPRLRHRVRGGEGEGGEI